MPKWITSNYTRGDLVIFDFANTGSYTDHIEILESISGSTLTTIGFNTSSSGSGNQANGEGVWRKTRQLSDVHGAYRPDYTSSLSADKVIAVAQGEIGYVEGANNDNKYGKAYGWNNVAYCVIGVWWCFKQAGMSSLFCGGTKVAGCATVKEYAQKHVTTTTAAISTCTAKAQLLEAGRAYDKGYCMSLQALLNAKAGTKLDVDGILGSKTIAAIEAFQKSKGLAQDGACGTATWSVLLK